MNPTNQHRVKTFFCLAIVAGLSASAQFPDPPSTCAAVQCLTGSTCREMYFRETDEVKGVCLSNPPPVTGNEGVCASGQPLLVSTGQGNVEEAACGRVPNRTECPPGYECVIDLGDRFSVCCQVKEKPGQCPTVQDGDFGICIVECADDSGCNGDEKCCPNMCGGGICTLSVTTVTTVTPPPPTCDTITCVPGQECKLQEVQCVTAPCPPLPTCVDIEKEGECPNLPSRPRRGCPRDCEADSNCPGFQKCCSDTRCGKMQCRTPRPFRGCARLNCSPGYRCERRWNNDLQTRKPICVPDHE